MTCLSNYQTSESCILIGISIYGILSNKEQVYNIYINNKASKMKRTQIVYDLNSMFTLFWIKCKFDVTRGMYFTEENLVQRKTLHEVYIPALETCSLFLSKHPEHQSQCETSWNPWNSHKVQSPKMNKNWLPDVNF